MMKITRRSLLTGIAGTTALTLPAPTPATDRPDMDGIGIVYLDGEAVMFDSRDRDHRPGHDAVTLSLKLGLRVQRMATHPDGLAPFRKHHCIIAVGPDPRYGYPSFAELPMLGRVIKRG